MKEKSVQSSQALRGARTTERAVIANSMIFMRVSRTTTSASGLRRSQTNTSRVATDAYSEARERMRLRGRQLTSLAAKNEHAFARRHVDWQHLEAFAD